MKNKVMIFAMAAVAMLAVSCQKDRVDGMILIAEGFNNNNSKVLVDSVASAWATGDVVRINDKEASVTVAGSTASVSLGEEVTSPFYGVYPASIYDDNDGANYTLDLPATYTYAISDGKQNLASPMVGYTTDNSTMVFKHVTAAVNVEVKNYHDYAITVDQITISSNNYKINGSVVVELDNDITVAPQSTETASEKTVTMTFDGGATLTVPAGQTAIVQVPVLPVGDGNKFTVSIQVSKTSPAVSATLTRTQTTGGALARANLGYAMYSVGGPFSVSNSKKVVFSKGNLQYHPKNDAWQFAPNQYDAIGAGNANIADNYDGWIDLFGWGTGNNPTNISTTAGDYSSFNDWGTAAASNIGTGWRTLTKDEWVYMFNTRTTSTSNLPGSTNVGTARYSKASVNGVNGMVFFPDNYTHPQGVSVSGDSYYNGASTAYNRFSVTAGWEKMELAGAIFVPVAGSRNEKTVDMTGAKYWSSTSRNANYAYWLYIAAYVGNPQASDNNSSTKAIGGSVRLVRDVE